jgi:putative transposase
MAFEDIRRIRKLYQKGNYQGHAYRSRLNNWSFAEIKRLIGYKAAWEGVPVIQLSVKETRGTSQLCPRCGKKITQVDRRTRQLWCDECKRWMDRDVVAVMNLSIKGRAFLSSVGEGVFERPEGLADEAMKGNPEMPVILRVDASKLSFRHKPRAWQNLVTSGSAHNS